MFSKGSKLYSIFNAKCPECHEGAFFVAHPYNLKKIGDTYEKCDSCGVNYSKEPGFYYGAMYVAYGLGVAIFISAWVATWGLNLSVSAFNLFLVVSGVLLLGTPYIYHLSKIIWANLFFKYKKEYNKQNTIT